MIYFLRNFNTRFQLLLLLIALFVGFSLSGWAQCVSSVAQTDILCDGSNITISATVGSQVPGLSSSVVWSNGQTGPSFTFDPNCNNIDCFEFTPCIPSGTSVPSQSFVLGPFSGTAPAGGSSTHNFTLSGYCFQEGPATYTGNLAISLSGNGSDNVSFELTTPDGDVNAAGPFTIDQINGLSPINIALLGLNADPNGTWTVKIIAHNGPVGYTVSASTITIPAFTTNTAVCADVPVEFCVLEGCPDFVSASTSSSNVCSGAPLQLNTLLDPAGSTAVTYDFFRNGTLIIDNGTTGNPIIYPENTTCSVQNHEYRVTITCIDGSIVANNVLVGNVNVYPQIGSTNIENTSTTSPCSITVTPSCSSFTVNGQATQDGSVVLPVLPGQNNQFFSVIVSNGLNSCNQVTPHLVQCQGVCEPPVVSAVTKCISPNINQFFIDVTFAPPANNGASEYYITDSQGNTLNVGTDAGVYQIGPFSNNYYVEVIVENPDDPDCNVNLGIFQENCKPCPYLTSATGNLSGTQCEGQTLNLTATVAGGALYTLSWLKNGIKIGEGLNLSHTLTADGCEAQTQTFTAILKCNVVGGGPQDPDTLNIAGGDLTVWPLPRFGIDFERSFDNCEFTLEDNCGNLTITQTGGPANISPGTGNTVFNYDVKFTAAPTTCKTSVALTVTCPNEADNCHSDPGKATSPDNVVCWNDQFDINNQGIILADPGYKLGYAIMQGDINSNPYGQVASAITAGRYTGPYTTPPGNMGTFTNNGSQSWYNGAGDYCFMPFLSFTATSGNKFSASGTINIPAASLFDCGQFICPEIRTQTITLSNIPFCKGATTYNIQLWMDGSEFPDPLDNGGTSSDFPALNGLHDDGTFNQTGWTLNPNGSSITIVGVNISPLWSVSIQWTVNVTLNQSFIFPYICQTCNTVCEPKCIKLLPDISLTGCNTSTSVCAGTAIDLTKFNPTANIPGTITWHKGNPNSGSTELITNPTNYTPTSSGAHFALFEAEGNDDCEKTCLLFIDVKPTPNLQTPQIDPICKGDKVDLTQYDTYIKNGGTGLTLKWYKNDPDGIPTGYILDNNGSPPNDNPKAQYPRNGDKYVAVVTNTQGCKSKVTLVYTVNNPPNLLPVLSPYLCPGTTVDLRDYESQFTNAPGSFIWYNGNPNSGGTPINPNGNNEILVTPTNGQTYWVKFTSSETNCFSISSMQFFHHTLPSLNTPTPAAICDGEHVNLTTYEDDIINILITPGTFLWYNGNPNSGGILITNPEDVVPGGGEVYYAVFTQTSTGCSASVNFSVPVNELPIINTNLPTPNTLCANPAPVNLVALQPQITPTNTNSFIWYKGEPGNGGLLLDANGLPPGDDPAQQTLTNNTTTVFWGIITTIAGCKDTVQIEYSVYAPLEGVAIIYDCVGTTGLQIDLSGVTGGDGGPYAVTNNSPNKSGDILAQGDPYTVIIEDGSFGCTVTIDGVVNCCVPDPGVATAPTATEVCVDSDIVSENTSPAITFSDNPSGANEGTPDYVFIITSSQLGDSIFALSPTGAYDFTNAPPGEYCFTGLAYNESQIDAAADVMVGPGDYNLQYLLELAASVGLISPLTIENVAANLPTIENVSGIDLCYAFQAEPIYCIEAINCQVCTPPAQPTNPQNGVYCSTTDPVSISVAAPGTGLEIAWFTLPSGGTQLATGNVFTPANEGTYYAETQIANFPGCVSLSRTAVTLTKINPPNPATVQQSANLCNAGNTYPDNINLMTLVSGNSSGNWSENPLNPSTGNLVGSNFNASGIPPGAYTLTYTLTATSPCQNISYNTIIQVIDCQNCVPPAAPTNPQGATYCTTNTIPAISVADPGTGYLITWYDAPVGGNAVGFGASFTASGPGSYYAQTSVSGDAACVSLTRTQVDLVGISPPSASVNNAVVLCLSAEDGPTSVAFADLISSGQTDGTWTEISMPASGGFSPSGFDGIAAGEGTYTVRYTVSATPCADIAYDITIYVVDCANIACNADAGEPIPPTDTQACNDSSNPNENISSPISGWAQQPSGVLQGTPNYAFIISSTNQGDSIIGLSPNGAFNFTGFAEGEYCFTGLAYNNAQVDAAADNLLGPGNYTLADLLAIAAESGFVSPFTVPNVEANLPLIGNLTGVTLCTDFQNATAWCVDVGYCQTACVTPAAPTNPQNNSYCVGSPTTSISVADPGTGFVITWFTQAVGGSIAGVGASLTPASAGTYYAETSVVGFASCKSTTRTPATLTAITPPNGATLTINTNLCSKGLDFPNNLTLSTLVLSGNTAGVWSEASGNPSTGNISGGKFNASNIKPGTYTLNYTIKATAPCTDLIFTTIINVIDCESCVPPNPPANPQSATYCTTEIIPEIAVDEPNPDQVIVWFDAAAGGNELGQGAVFAPGVPGIYYAETQNTDDPLCKSLVRTEVNLIAVAPPVATVTDAVVLCTKAIDGATKVFFADLIAGGNTDGIWENLTPSPGYSATGWDALKSGLGTFKVRYRLQAEPCADQTYEVIIYVIDCANVECKANAGVPTPPTDLDVCADNDNPSENLSSASPGFDVPPSGVLEGTPNYTYIVTGPDSLIIGLTNTGVFDFTGKPEGEYCFTGLAYNNKQVDAAADELLEPGNYTLGDLLTVAESSGFVDPFTVPNVEANLPLIGNLTGVQLCLDFAAAPNWCITVKYCDTECVPPAKPTGAFNNTFCANSIPDIIAVADPGPEFTIVWFDVPTGGSALSSGYEFLPPAAGTYYAETQFANFTSCKSTSRTAVTLSEITPPEPAVVLAGTSLCIALDGPNPNSINLFDMVVDGNFDGNFEEDFDNPELGKISSNVFNALGITPGSYKIWYRVTAIAPCADLLYPITLTVVDCETCVPPANATNPKGGVYCTNEAIPAVSVDNPGADYLVNWYDAEIGGNLLGTGVSFTPSTAGTYWAQIINANDPTCASPNRVSATLTPVAPPVATISDAVLLCTVEADGPTQITLAELIIDGDSTGTWMETTPPSGGLGAGVFDGLKSGIGTFELAYTLTTAGCNDVVYPVTVYVLNCADIICTPSAGVAAAPKDFEICKNSPIPAENKSVAYAGFTTKPSGPLEGTPNYTFIVTDPTGLIVGLSKNGVFDFSGYSEGNYCFTGMAYNEAEINKAANALLGPGKYTLANLLDVAKNSGLVDPFTVPNVEAQLPLIGMLTGINLCTDFMDAPAYCMDVVSCACEVAVNTAIPTGCDALTNTYNVTINISYSAAPSGQLSITIGSKTGVFEVVPGESGTFNFVMSGLTADGKKNLAVTAAFNAGCTSTLQAAYNAPESCEGGGNNDCLANAGTIIAPEIICNDVGSIPVSGEGYNNTSGHEQWYILANQVDKILGISQTELPKQPNGTYRIYAINILKSNAPTFALGDQISEIIAQTETCFSLSAKANLEIEKPIVVEEERNCLPAILTGKYDVGVLVSGGKAPYNAEVYTEYDSLVVSYAGIGEYSAFSFKMKNEDGYKVFITDSKGCQTVLDNSDIEDCVALPIALLAFTGEVQTAGNMLSWSTATETDNVLFTVLHSTNGIDFNSIGTLKGAGNSIDFRNYTLFHPEKTGGMHYYYLQTTATDGAVKKASGIIALYRTTDVFALIAVKPIPTNDILQVTINSPLQQTLKIVVTDITGRVALQTTWHATEGNNNYQLQMGSLPAGLYDLRIYNQQNEVVTHRIAKQ